MKPPQPQSLLDAVCHVSVRKKQNSPFWGRFLAAHKARCQHNTSRSPSRSDKAPRASPPLQARRPLARSSDPAGSSALPQQPVEVAYPFRTPASGYLFHQWLPAPWLPRPPGAYPAPSDPAGRGSPGPGAPAAPSLRRWCGAPTSETVTE